MKFPQTGNYGFTQAVGKNNPKLQTWSLQNAAKTFPWKSFEARKESAHEADWETCDINVPQLVSAYLKT